MFVPQVSAPPGPKPVMVRRVEIAQAALDHFRGKPFAWGTNDCARLAAFVLKAAGYKPGLARFGSYRTERAARAALNANGMSSMADAIDSIKGLIRIAPLGALPCDLISFPGPDNWDALAVALGNGRILAFYDGLEDHRCSVLAANLSLAGTAWGVAPCLR
jgi:hypothetical protein